MGSCFTEHIGNALAEMKFSVLQNPSGILFGPDSVCKSLQSYVQNKLITENDLFQFNEVWNSWQHHSRFSDIDKHNGIKTINESITKANQFLKSADWLVITLGSSFSYRLTDKAALASESISNIVANCHRAPANWFHKEMMEIEEIEIVLSSTLETLRQFNPGIQFIFTISPVRHIRDGVVENNRSKARLIEAVHHITEKYTSAYYFPAYELVIDVLRDYRFYDIDLVHPNYAATEFVLEKFIGTCIDSESQQLMQEIRKIIIARKHKPFQPATNAHQQFLKMQISKIEQIQQKYNYLNFDEELAYFSTSC